MAQSAGAARNSLRSGWRPSTRRRNTTRVDVDGFRVDDAGHGGPGDVARFFEIDADTDVRELLPSIRVPTLVVHRRRTLTCRSSTGSIWLSTSPARNSWSCPGPRTHGTRSTLATEVGRFLATIHQEEIDFDRFLGTVLFTDIVDSTRSRRRSATEHGRPGEQHHRIVRGSSRGTEAPRWTRPATGSSRRSTAPLAPSDARWRSKPRCARSRSRSARRPHRRDADDRREGWRDRRRLGARIVSLAGPSEVLVSQTVRDLVAGSGLVFEAAGEHELKGVPDRWQVYRVVA